MLPRNLFPLLAVSAVAEVHYLYSGFFSGSTIAGIEFDDEALSLSLVKNITSASDDGSKSIALDVSITQILYLCQNLSETLGSQKELICWYYWVLPKLQDKQGSWFDL